MSPVRSAISRAGMLVAWRGIFALLDTDQSHCSHGMQAMSRSGMDLISTLSIILASKVCTLICTLHTVLIMPCFAASPVDKQSNVLPASTSPAGDFTPSLNDSEPGGATAHQWGDFGSRIAFDFAEHHFGELQSSASGITRRLDIWAAQALRAGERAQWNNLDQLHNTINAVKLGEAAWSTDEFYYTGERSDRAAPKWMDVKHELCWRNVCWVVHQQLVSPEFKDRVDYCLYRQFNHGQNRVYSNVMSGERAWQRAVCL
jgi:hypothetical protein